MSQFDTVKVRALKPGDRIGIAAPASPFDRELFDAGISRLAAMGFEPVIDEAAYARDRHLAGPDGQRARHLMALFEDPDIKAIACARGGFGSMRLLSLLDVDMIRRHPKALIGFSDVTALLTVLTDQCRMPVLHGPVVTAIGRVNDRSRQSLVEVLSGRLDPVEADPSATLVGGTAAGRLAGGNLSTLCHLVGTEYAPRFRGRIVFLEDVNEKPYRIDRMLSQMRMAGCFEDVAGVVLGGFTDCGATDDIHQVFNDHFGGLGIPMVAGLPAGHGDVNVTLVLGVDVELDADRGRIRYIQNPFTE